MKNSPTPVSGQKNVLAVHDISCVGRCSLTVALPIVSAMGVECRVLPTALLSTHTGGFTGFTCLDLTDEMKKIIAAWDHLGLKFDGIYSGFMASAEQIDVLKNIIKIYRKENIVAVIDPVMADGGKLYSIFDDAFVKKMGEVVSYADVLIPNITEACLLAGVGYKDGPYTKEYVENLLSALKKKGAKAVVLTGVSFDDKTLGAATLDSSGKVEYYFREKIEGYYHGTGDVFGSVLTAALMKGKPLTEAAKSAVDFVIAAIKATPVDADKKYGVDFETALASGAAK